MTSNTTKSDSARNAEIVLATENLLDSFQNRLFFPTVPGYRQLLVSWVNGDFASLNLVLETRQVASGTPFVFAFLAPDGAEGFVYDTSCVNAPIATKVVGDHFSYDAVERLLALKTGLTLLARRTEEAGL